MHLTAESIACSSRARQVREVLPKGWSCKEAPLSTADGGAEELSSQWRNSPKVSSLVPKSHGYTLRPVSLARACYWELHAKCPETSSAEDRCCRSKLLLLICSFLCSSCPGAPAQMTLWAIPSQRCTDVLTPECERKQSHQGAAQPALKQGWEFWFPALVVTLGAAREWPRRFNQGGNWKPAKSN